MPKIFLAPSTQGYNQYYSGGSEEYYMNLLADAIVPYLRAAGIRYLRNNPNENVVSSVSFANGNNYDLYLSLHSNSSPEGSEGTLQGPDIYYYPTSKGGQLAAQIVAENMRAVYPTPELVNIIPSTYYYELQKTRASTIIVEVAYHDNENDAKWITQNIEGIARALALSVSEYLQVPFAEPSEMKKGTVRIASGWLNIRNDPSFHSEIIGKAYNGDRLTILQTLSGWYYVDYNGLSGYVSSKFVELD